MTGSSNANDVIELIREHQPDAVSLVEVDETWDRPSTLTDIAEKCGYKAVFVPVFEYGSDSPTGGFGNAILTKLSVQTVEQRQLTWPSTVYDGSEPSELRSVLLVTVGLPSGESLCIGSTHLPRSDGTARRQALNRLAAILKIRPEPWIVCGDFNTPASTWTAQESVAPSGSQPTYPTDRPTESIDYAVAAPGISLDAEALAAPGSDHLPISVTLLF